MDIAFIIKNFIRQNFRRQGNFLKAQEVCGEIENAAPGIDSVPDIDRDWTTQETTPDQKRIEEELLKLDLQGKSILHIGVGTSSLAKLLCDKLEHMDGITLSAKEQELASTLNFDNYQVHIYNKYSRDVIKLNKRYDLIVDNNFSSWCCCKYHFYCMFDNYVRLLKSGGAIYTDREGMDWVQNSNIWRLNYKDLEKIGAMFNLRPERVTDFVFKLSVKDSAA